MTQPFPTKQGMPCQRLKQILQTLADPTPEQVVAEIDRCLSGGLGLPPRVFFETTEQASVAISITDPDAIILYANAAFERVTGYRADEVIGKNESLLSYRTTPRGYYERMWTDIKSGKSWAVVQIDAPSVTTFFGVVSAIITTSSSDHTWSSTPASIAGVTRSVL